MEIVLNDTNILIDLYNSGLLNSCEKLNLEFRTLDLVLAEITSTEQLEAVNNMVENGALKVFSSTPQSMAMVFDFIENSEDVSNLSGVDISVLIYAKQNGCRLLTGDKKLKERARRENVNVSGILFIIDSFIAEQVLPTDELLVRLDLLLKTNKRLPDVLIRQRIEALTNSNHSLEQVSED